MKDKKSQWLTMHIKNALDLAIYEFSPTFNKQLRLKDLSVK